MIIDLYTIEYGYMMPYLDDNGICKYEYECTHEVSFISKQEYEKALLEITLSATNSSSREGYYIECYFDKDLDLNENELEDIKICCNYDSPPKSLLIKEIIFQNEFIKDINESAILSSIIGTRYATLEELKEVLEEKLDKKVTSIFESESENFAITDNMIDYEVENDGNVYTLYYLRDNENKYYITEI